MSITSTVETVFSEEILWKNTPPDNKGALDGEADVDPIKRSGPANPDLKL